MRAADGPAELHARRDGDPRGAVRAGPHRSTDRPAPRAHRRLAGGDPAGRAARCVDHPDPDSFLAAFSGDERPVADYLAGEVLSRISDADGELLRRTSIADPIPTALAAELSDRRDAADVLSALERSTGLVVASGPHRTEFRIQELMRTYLTADLYRHGPALAAQPARSEPRSGGRPRTGPSKRCAMLLGRPTAACSAATSTGGRPTWWRGASTPNCAAPSPRWSPSAPRPTPGCHSSWAQIHIGSGDREAARADVRRARAAGRRSRRARARATSGQPPSGWPDWAARPRQTGPHPRTTALAALTFVGRAAVPALRRRSRRPAGRRSGPRGSGSRARHRP